ncbi:MAG: glycoside hydrolase family 30 protein [Methylacidiphilales bacterium]|nr:glycoside hydrolase family 30 protein [Candidatus Methylacidiphilales bacterium]
MTTQHQLSLWLTARDLPGRLAAQPPQILKPLNEEINRLATVWIDDLVSYQEIEGFGGAFTEAAAVTLGKMPEKKQEEILRAYFDPKTGNAYTLCRSHINSCDFSTGNYAYCEKEGDTALASFSIERDRQALLPMIQRSLKLSGGTMKLFASPWSPPAWMKTTNQMNRGGQLKPEYRAAWAEYYVRYIQEYAKAGVNIWGLTVQNEPEAIQTWDSCVYSGAEERDFVRDHLGPALERAGLGHVKIIIWDHNRDHLYARAKTIYSDSQAARYIWGAGFHWYSANVFENVQRTHEAWPNKKLLFTEGCQEGGPHPGSWLTGERYAQSVIQDLNHWTVGWVDWNLVLDETGGPNHVGNLCSAPILADTRTGEAHYQSSYYYLGHFSRFIRPGAKRILTTSSRDELEVTACKNPDGSLVAVILNRSETPIQMTLKFNQGEVNLESPRRSILTAVLSKH